jgi:hypothetical protein
MAMSKNMVGLTTVGRGQLLGTAETRGAFLVEKMLEPISGDLVTRCVEQTYITISYTDGMHPHFSSLPT